MGKSVNRSAGTGRFVSKAAAARWPSQDDHRAGWERHQQQSRRQPLRLHRAIRHRGHREAEPRRHDPAEGLTHRGRHTGSPGVPAASHRL